MNLLRPSEYHRVTPLFDAYEYLRPVIYAVLEGTQPGQVLVDDVVWPASAVLWGADLFVAGEAGNEAFNAALLDRVANDAVPNRAHVLLYAPRGAWHGALQELLAPLEALHLVRSLFRFDADAYRERSRPLRKPLPEGFRLARLDASTAGEAGGMPDLWGSVEQFLAHGWGYCVLDGDEFASSCQTVFVGDNSAEIGVGTREPYRRRGLARAAAIATLDECLARGFLPEWGCVYNPASGALGQSLGFCPLPDAPFYYVKGASWEA